MLTQNVGTVELSALEVEDYERYKKLTERGHQFDRHLKRKVEQIKVTFPEMCLAQKVDN
jgi:hypothetical protein